MSAKPRTSDEEPGRGRVILSVRHLRQEFGDGGLPWRKVLRVQAVDDVSFDVVAGEVLGLIGESGSGKSTIGRIILQLQEPTAGNVEFKGVDVASMSKEGLRQYRRGVQMIFQNSLASLNPRRLVGDQIGDPLVINGVDPPGGVRARVEELAALVGLSVDILDRYPHGLSSGQRQRVGIARSLAGDPEVIVADEPVSALDVSVQAQVVNLLRRLQRDLNLTLIFISHDLRVVRFLCDRVAVLYLGRIMEIGTSVDVTRGPIHPYTRALVDSMPTTDRELNDRELIRGDISQQAPDPTGCVFAPRCSLRSRLGDPERCTTERPELRSFGAGRQAACHFADDPSQPAGVQQHRAV